MTERKSLSLRKFEAHVCVCADTRGEHRRATYSDPSHSCNVAGCDCKEFSRRKATRTQKRSFKRGGSNFELDIKKMAEAHGLPARKISGAGNPDVIIGPEGDELVAIECHLGVDAKTYSHQEKKLAQAVRLARGRAGAPLAVYVYRLKQQRVGEQTTTYAFMEADTLFRLLRSRT